MTAPKTIAAQLNALHILLARAAAPLSVEQIEIQSRLGLDRRTVQRRLEALVADGRAAKSGKTFDARYTASTPAPAPPSLDGALPPVILSPASRKVQTYLRQPPSARKIVGYNRAFLDAYRPNETAYLPAAERARLLAVGSPDVLPQDAGTVAQDVLNRLLIDLSWNSSRLEGNTYSLLDTQRLVEFGEEAEGKDRREAQMILNHKAAIEFLVQSAAEISFDRRTLQNLHALLADGLLEDPQSPGRLRTKIVNIGGSTYHPPGVPQQIAECFQQIADTASAIRDPLEQAFFIMVQLPYLQPFDDVNKRVSRLAANIPLIRGNFAPLSFIDMPRDLYTQAMLGVYELNDISLLREVFVWAYERSASRYTVVRQQIGDPDPFRMRYRQELKDVIGGIIRAAMPRRAAYRHIASWAAAHVPAQDVEAFRQLVETEVLALHEGNYARYQVRPAEFLAWEAVWQRGP